MERSGGINNMRLPTSPMSFPSSNINIPGSLVLDGSASIQHLSQQQQQQAGQGSVPMGENNYSHIDKKPRLDVKQEDMLQQQQFLHQTTTDSSILVTVSETPTSATTAVETATRHSTDHPSYCSEDDDVLVSSTTTTCLRKRWENMRLACFHRHLRISGSVIFAEPSLEKDLRQLSIKAVQETVHEQFRVVREGHLRIIFSQDLKVNQLLQVAQKCQTTISESGSEGVSQQDLKSNSNMVLGAGRQLAKFMELQSLNDLGYPKRYIRTLQISEVVKSMKDLMNFTGDHKLGPIEGLKRLLEQTATAKLQRQKMQEMEQLGNSGAIYGSSQAQMALTSGTMNDLTGNSNNNNQTVGRAAMNGSAQAAAALTNYQSMLMRQNAMNNPNSNTCKQDAFSRAVDASPAVAGDV
ncbi:hypothetical protein Bca101_086885 [Brassica carinata]